MGARSSKSGVVVGCLLALGLCIGTVSSAADSDELATAIVSGYVPGPTDQPEAFPPLADVLVVGTSQNSPDPSATLNDVFTVDPATNGSASVATGVGVWGATADQENERILFTRSSTQATGFGDELFEVPFAGGDPVSLGIITDVTGLPFRVDGLAVSGGVLYGTNAGGGTTNGFFAIDWSTLIISGFVGYADSISGIDADPDTGVIYGVNDSTGQLVTLSTGGAISTVIAYPAGLTDIDGIAVGDGKAFLVTDESGSIPVYDIATGVFETPLTSPFTSADVFSGAAYAGAVFQPPQPVPAVPAVNGFGLVLLIGLVAAAALVILLRR